MGLDNYARIKEIQEIHSTEIIKKNSELRYIVSVCQSDKKASNLVSTFSLSLTRTNFSTSHLLLMLLSVIYKVINQLYDESNLLRTSMNQNFEEAQMTDTEYSQISLRCGEGISSGDGGYEA